jgi:putative phage-type endonuclease
MSAIVLTSTENMEYADWLDWRRKGIGGSDASAVCGINKYKSPVELWMDKTGQLPHDEAGEAAYWGTMLEGLVKSEFAKRTGIEVIPANQLLQSKEHPFMLANLDGICEHPIYGTCAFEAKTAGAYKSGEWENKIPDEYMLQIQHYMTVTGYMGAYIAVLIGGNTFKWKFVERDEELISMLILLEEEFWDHVRSNVPPALDGSEASVKFLNGRFPDSVPLSKIELPESAADIIRRYDAACERLERITEQKQEAENLLKQMLGENEAGSIGDRIVTWKSNVNRLRKYDHSTIVMQHK